MYVCTHSHTDREIGSSMCTKISLKIDENTSVSECISLSCLRNSITSQTCLSPQASSYSLSPQRLLLCPHAHPIPDSHHLPLNLLKNHCPSTSFLSRNGITQLHNKQTAHKKIMWWLLRHFTAFKHTIYVTPKASHLHCCPGSVSSWNIHPLIDTLNFAH